MSRTLSIVLLIIATVSLLIASVGFWARTSVLNEDGFVNIVTETFAQENVRVAIADEMINQAFQSRPLVRQIIRGPAENIIAGILDTSLVQGAVELMARTMYKVVVRVDGQEVAINLEPIKEILVTLTDVLNVDAANNINVDDIPNQIVILQEGQLPSLDPLWNTIDWVGFITGIIGVVLLVLVFWTGWSTSNRNDYLKWTGGSLAVGAVILLLITWPIGTTITRSVDQDSGRVLVAAVYENLIAQLRVQTVGLILLGIALWLLGWWLSRERSSRESGAAVVVAAPADQDVVVSTAAPTEPGAADGDSTEEAPAPA